MLKKLQDIMGCKAGAEDDEFGRVKDIYFDDVAWAVRYVVLDPGRWLPGRQVLVGREALEAFDQDRGALVIAMTREQIESGPAIAEDLPVSREAELMLAKHYGWVPYWQRSPVPDWLSRSYAQESSEASRRKVEGLADSQLRSLREVEGYRIEATDGAIGHVADAVVDTAEWAVRYLVVDTSTWLPGLLSRHVLIPPGWAREVSWAGRSVVVDVTRRQVQDSPDYDPSEPIDEDFEARLHAHYGRPHYRQREAPTQRR